MYGLRIKGDIANMKAKRNAEDELVVDFGFATVATAPLLSKLGVSADLLKSLDNLQIIKLSSESHREEQLIEIFSKKEGKKPRESFPGAIVAVSLTAGVDGIKPGLKATIRVDAGKADEPLAGFLAANCGKTWWIDIQDRQTSMPGL